MADHNYWSTTGDQGHIKISEDVVASIAAISVSETEGVHSLCTGLTSDIANFLGKKNLSRGVKVQFHGDVVEIDLGILAQYGYNICEVAKNTQGTICSAIESMTGLKVAAVNVEVCGISFETDGDSTSIDLSLSNN